MKELASKRAEVARDRVLRAIADHITPHNSKTYDEKLDRLETKAQLDTPTGKVLNAFLNLLDTADDEYWMNAVTLPANEILEKIAERRGT